MPDTISLSLTPDGRVFTLPLKEDAETVLEINSAFTFKENGMGYDALYTFDPQTGEQRGRHSYLQWTPQMPPVVEEAPLNHRYVFRVPSEWKTASKTITVRVNVDKFVEEFLIPPSEVRAALSGELKMTVRQTPLVVPLLPRIGRVALPALLAAGGVAFIIRRRMTWGGLSNELQEILLGIEQKYRAARAAMSREQGQTFPLADKLTALRDGAFVIARQIQKLRNAQQLVKRRVLEAEMSRLEQQLASLSDEAAKREGEIILSEKRKTLTLLDDLEQNASRCALRLTKIEATLDTLAVTLRHAQTQQSLDFAEETLRRQLDVEVTAIQDTTRELQAFEELRAQMMAQRR